MTLWALGLTRTGLCGDLNVTFPTVLINVGFVVLLFAVVSVRNSRRVLLHVVMVTKPGCFLAWVRTLCIKLWPRVSLR